MTAVITIDNLTMSYGSDIIQKDLTFTINRGDIFAIMGGSGCGKSTLLRHLIGLHRPRTGTIYYGTEDFWTLDDQEQSLILRKTGILYQSGALWSSMTLADNLALPLQQYTNLSGSMIQDIIHFKLSLVGLKGCEDYYPSEISGGMRKRAGLARAIVLDPEYLFFDEPSAGLDPVNAKNLDELIVEIRNSLGATVVLVTHELHSIFAIATNAVYLDAEEKTMLAVGSPEEMLNNSTHQNVIDFLTRGEGRRRTSS
ncbi:ABC transporter ATP-binding protein [Desulfogranum japonicum]|uniref:ABC transporter ATP-binding protein n=1 Tax=Desulfogranum japonicum TaxID=231447 RepID=UPI0004186C89|nr:ATP-binding cassette domain-containing protein [Desulfogranum japonicum]